MSEKGIELSHGGKGKDEDEASNERTPRQLSQIPPLNQIIRLQKNLPQPTFPDRVVL